MDCSLVLRESSMERRSLRNRAEDFNSPAGGAPASCLSARDQRSERTRTRTGSHRRICSTKPKGRKNVAMATQKSRLRQHVFHSNPVNPRTFKIRIRALPPRLLAGAVPTRYLNGIDWLTHRPWLGTDEQPPPPAQLLPGVPIEVVRRVPCGLTATGADGHSSSTRSTSG